MKSCRAVGDPVNALVASRARPQGLCNFLSLQYPRWLKTDRITVKNPNTGKIYFSKKRSSSAFIKKKKEHTNVAESYWGTHAPSAHPVPTALSINFYVELVNLKHRNCHQKNAEINLD